MCNLPAESFEFVKRVEQEPTYRTTYYDTTSPLKSIVSRSVPLPRRPHPAASPPAPRCRALEIQHEYDRVRYTLSRDLSLERQREGLMSHMWDSSVSKGVCPQLSAHLCTLQSFDSDIMCLKVLYN